MRRILLAVLFGLAVLGRAEARDVTIAVGGAFNSLDPHYHNLSSNSAVGQHIFDRLVHQDENQRLLPALATSWRTLDDLTWEFELRRDVKWHDGSLFTADDVVFTFERVPTVANSPSSYSIYTRPVSEIVAVGPHTLRMKTPVATPLLPNFMSGLPIISRKHGTGATTADYNSGRAAIGTGPYRLVEFVPGDRVVFERNEDYWGAKQPWTRVTYRLIANESARIAALLAGDVDLIDTVPTHDVERLTKDPRLAVASKAGVRNIYLYADARRDETPFAFDNDGQKLAQNPLRDERVRRALSLAINRAAIVERVMSGQAAASGQFLPQGTMGWDPDLKPDPYDPEQAKKLLAEAGYPQGFKLTIHGPNDRYVNDSNILVSIAQMWTRVGVKTQVEAMPTNVYFSRGARDEFSVGLMGWGTGTGEPDSPMLALLATYDRDRGRGVSNRSLYSNPEFDALLDKALATLDPGEREKVYRAATKVAMADLGIIPLHHQVNIWAMRKDLAYNARNDERTMAMELRPRQ